MLTALFNARPLIQRILILYIFSIGLIIGITTAVASVTVNNGLKELVVNQQSGKLHAVEKLIQTMGDFRLEGDKLYAGPTLLNENFALVDDLKRRMDNEITIFAGDTRVATTLEADGKRLVGTKLTGPAQETVLNQHKEYHGTTEVLGQSFLGSYLPLFDTQNKPIGVLFVGIKRSTFQHIILEVILHTAMVCAPVALGLMLLTGWVIQKALAPIREIERNIQTAITQFSTVEKEIESAALNSIDVANSNVEDAAVVASGSEETTSQMSSVASATAELSSSVDNILRHVNHMTNTVVKQADTRMTEAITATTQLLEASHNISNVMELIGAIASQTNLLALNASIEAARAGDAGRGFAVVADEVKKLAAQTSQATEGIGSEIEAMQAKTQSAVEAIELIRKALGDIVETSTAVSNSVSEQTQATQDISNSLDQTNLGVQQIARGISNINGSTQKARDLAGNVKHQLGLLHEQTTNLYTQLGNLNHLVHGQRHG